MSDLPARVDALERVGLALERVEGIPQDERGVTTFPDGTQLAWLKDPDGNWLSLAQFPL